MKTLIGHKYLQFNKSEYENILKFDKHDNDGYIPLLLLSYQTKSNCPSNLSKKARTLTHIISLIKKTTTRKSSNMAGEFPSRGNTKVTKNSFKSNRRRTQLLVNKEFGILANLSTFTIKNNHLLREDLISHLISSAFASNQFHYLGKSSKSQLTSFTPINKHCYLKEELQTQPVFIILYLLVLTLTLLISLPQALNLLKRTTIYGINIVIVEGSKTYYLLHVVCVNIFGGLLYA